jgi:hypothetical protein
MRELITNWKESYHVSYKIIETMAWVQGNGGGKVMDNPKPGLKQKQSKHDKSVFNVNLFS